MVGTQAGELIHYTVSGYVGLHELRQEVEAKVMAAITPEAAAELILGERLVRLGKVRDLRARVICDDPDGSTQSILLYRLPTVPPDQ